AVPCRCARQPVETHLSAVEHHRAVVAVLTVSTGRLPGEHLVGLAETTGPVLVFVIAMTIVAELASVAGEFSIVAERLAVWGAGTTGTAVGVRPRHGHGEHGIHVLGHDSGAHHSGHRRPRPPRRTLPAAIRSRHCVVGQYRLTLPAGVEPDQ